MNIQEIAEQQIIAYRKTIDYDTQEYPIKVLVQKYLTKLKKNNDISFNGQQECIWSKKHQSNFIESILLGLPISCLFVTNISSNKKHFKIVDGYQRICTLVNFTQNKLELIGLKKLNTVNGFKFSDLSFSQQRRFNHYMLRIIELTENVNKEVLYDIFVRINPNIDY